MSQSKRPSGGSEDSCGLVQSVPIHASKAEVQGLLKIMERLLSATSDVYDHCWSGFI